MSAPEDAAASFPRLSGLPEVELFVPRLLASIASLLPALAGLGVILALTGLVVGGVAGTLMLAAGSPLLAVAGLGLRLRSVSLRRGADRAGRLLAEFEHDPDVLLMTDRHGAPLGGNAAARKLGLDTPSPAAALDRWSAEPTRVVAALMTEALATGAAAMTLGGGERGLRVSVLAPGGPAIAGVLIWRLSETAAPAGRSLDMLAVPVLTLGAAGQVVAANRALRRLLGDGTGQATLSAMLGELTASLEPAGGEGTLASVTLPGCNGHMLAWRQTGRDGQSDILLLPPRVVASLEPGAARGHEFEDLPVALALLAPDGRIRASNRLARALLRLDQGDRRFFSEVVEGLGRPVADWLEDARLGRALNRPEVLRAVLPAQETFVQIILRRDPGETDGLVAVISDATEMKSLEARFVQSQKMQAIGQLAGGVAHDFNNLLTAISGHCDLLLRARDRFDPDYEDLMQIHQNANRAAALVRQLLAFSRKQTLKTERLSVESLLEELTHLLTRLVGARITLRLSHGAGLGPIRADRRQLEQVIMNLVVNARDAMPMGGEIRIETEAITLTAEREIARARLPAGDYALIRVSDTGVGIAPDVIDKIFEPFFTTKRPGEGTGLGLSTAYGIVKQMGGFIFVESTEGTGTTFSLYFAIDRSSEGGDGARPTRHARHDPAPAPAAQIAPPRPARPALAPAAEPADATLAPPSRLAAAPAARAPAPPSRAAGDTAPEAGADERRPPTTAAPGRSRTRPAAGVTPAGGTLAAARAAPPPLAAPAAPEGTVVLLVEDEAPVRAFAARALRLQGYLVIEAESGDQALEFLADPGLRVDVFVTDVIMPGLDGPGWIAQALASRPGTPVVFVSGYAEDTVSAALRRIPRAVFLAKPFSLDELAGAIARQLAVPA